METKEIMALIAETFAKGAASTIVTIKSADSKMNKGRGENRNPFIGHVTIKTTYTGFVMGTDYSSSLERTAARMGNEESEVRLKESWHKPASVYGEWFSTDKKTETKLYLKLQRNEKQVACHTTSIYFIDGREATEIEVELIKAWLKKDSHTQSSTQIEMGIDKAHEQHFLLPQLDTIVLIKQGEKVVEPMKLFQEAASLSITENWL